MIIFRTPGTLDMRAFTTMGMSAKPNSTRPIGIFGTGLKYAVAVLTRLGAQIEVHTGGHRYWFETVPVDFRGAEFQQIVMRRDSFAGGEGWRLGRRQKLPFTTQYGRNWEPWMAFRELYANTMDEGGECYASGIITPPPSELRGQTKILVSDCEPFEQAYRNRADIFLDVASRPVVGKTASLEILEGETQRLFYQGLRAKDLQKPTMFTYNFLTSHHLTEDRQLAHEFIQRAALADAVATLDDADLIEKIVKADKDHWEHGLEPNSWVQPSAAFRSVMSRLRRGVGGGWSSYYGRHDDSPQVRAVDLWMDAQRPWRVEGDTVYSATGQELFDKPSNMNKHNWETLSARLIKIANGKAYEDEEPQECSTCGNIHEGDCPPIDEAPPSLGLEIILTHRDSGLPLDERYAQESDEPNQQTELRSQEFPSDDEGVPF